VHAAHHGGGAPVGFARAPSGDEGQPAGAGVLRAAGIHAHRGNRYSRSDGKAPLARSQAGVRLRHPISEEIAMIRCALPTALCATVGLYCSCSLLPSAQPSATAAVPTANPPAALFTESFGDARLLQRGWYD